MRFPPKGVATRTPESVRGLTLLRSAEQKADEASQESQLHAKGGHMVRMKQEKNNASRGRNQTWVPSVMKPTSIQSHNHPIPVAHTSGTLLHHAYEQANATY